MPILTVLLQVCRRRSIRLRALMDRIGRVLSVLTLRWTGSLRALKRVRLLRRTTRRLIGRRWHVWTRLLVRYNLRSVGIHWTLLRVHVPRCRLLRVRLTWILRMLEAVVQACLHMSRRLRPAVVVRTMIRLLSGLLLGWLMICALRRLGVRVMCSRLSIAWWHENVLVQSEKFNHQSACLSDGTRILTCGSDAKFRGSTSMPSIEYTSPASSCMTKSSSGKPSLACANILLTPCCP